MPGQWDIPALTMLMAAILAYAWLQRKEGHITAEDGAGYYLGITGSVMMLLLLLYPLRKRIRAMNWIGAVPGWFRIHMIFGVLGPSLVVLHSNFTLGSLNSQVALFCMLIVAGSGYIGRFLYKHVYKGLTGHKRSASELREAASEMWPALLRYSDDVRKTEARLTEFEDIYLRERPDVVAALFRALTGDLKRRSLRRALLGHAKVAEKMGGESEGLKRAIDDYFLATKRAQSFVLYERLFSLWHLLHLPLFLILFAAAILHVVAVHLY
ncbi:MAG: hypothetical protein WBN04_16905 [Paracoccaceae bacterium]